MAIDGEIIQKLVARNGQPFSSDEDRKENDRVRKLIGERKLETPQQKSKRLAELERQRVKEIVLDAFDFKLAGEMRAQNAANSKGRVWGRSAGLLLEQAGCRSHRLRDHRFVSPSNGERSTRGRPPRRALIRKPKRLRHRI